MCSARALASSRVRCAYRRRNRSPPHQLVSIRADDVNCEFRLSDRNCTARTPNDQNSARSRRIPYDETFRTSTRPRCTCRSRSVIFSHTRLCPRRLRSEPSSQQRHRSLHLGWAKSRMVQKAHRLQSHSHRQRQNGLREKVEPRPRDKTFPAGRDVLASRPIFF